MEAMTQDMVARIKSHSQWAREHLDELLQDSTGAAP